MGGAGALGREVEKEEAARTAQTIRAVPLAGAFGPSVLGGLGDEGHDVSAAVAHSAA